MDGSILNLGLFLGATFAAALVAGLAGFAFGLIAAAIWLHILTPLQTATLIVGYGLIVQGYAVWKLRHALSWDRLWPFLSAPRRAWRSACWCSDGPIRRMCESRLAPCWCCMPLYGLARPALQTGACWRGCRHRRGLPQRRARRLTGLAGIIVVIWSGVRGWPKDVQRGVFQPVGVATFAMTAIGLGATGTIAADTLKLFLFGLPVLLAGTWLGLKLYGRLDEDGFRRVVLLLLLISGILLIASLR